MKRIAVFGAGAVGGVIAAQLSRAGKAVSVVARGTYLDAMRSQGLRLRIAAEEWLCPVTATDDAAALGPQDLVICTVKAHSLPAAAPALASLLGPETSVIFAQNGIPWWYFRDEEHQLARQIGIQRTIGCVIRAPCSVVAPGVVQLDSGHSRYYLGEPDNSLSPRLQQIISALEPALPVIATTRIRDEIWQKLRINVASSLLTTLTHSFTHDVLQRAPLRELFIQLLDETRAVAGGYGVLLTEPGESLLAGLSGGQHAPSMLQDLLAGRPLELDAQLLTVQALARQANIATPVLDILLPLLQQRARATAQYHV
ncbi:2-dehydropantoate 2-reductase [Erwiniaceae bacterium BAC15a-03b]|uniref:2-dehydropantoate 2-reductase n=1 Tax=Winslowiella arboricola TaxID=2978220 RepID=A0A9J6PTK2_9GAMM|nr:2-dehydropantoate 2-reductase [Winslowiella arboricola]MCU5772491.1 2-dehydropantoate 2-reductase [Winslowiella arboricola]MCU5779013.1 2-dehydropantoate 2-reductase [Winslowiella arboricola]